MLLFASMRGFVVCLYREGVFEDDKCNKTNMGHSMLLVGYGTEADKDYWIVKNR